MKKAIKILIIPIIIVIICILSLSYTITKNKDYQDNMLKKIKKNYNINNIDYLNYYNNYYIIKNKEDIIVLNNKYEEVLKEKISNIDTNKYELVYRDKKLMYEETTLKKDKVIYTYYDIKSGKEINQTTLEK